MIRAVTLIFPCHTRAVVNRASCDPPVKGLLRTCNVQFRWFDSVDRWCFKRGKFQFVCMNIIYGQIL